MVGCEIAFIDLGWVHWCRGFGPEVLGRVTCVGYQTTEGYRRQGQECAVEDGETCWCHDVGPRALYERVVFWMDGLGMLEGGMVHAVQG